MSFISSRTFQFAFFDRVLNEPIWRGRTVLDFGGNTGNMLRDPRCTIEPRNYWCIDVSGDAIEAGREAFPEGHWIHYDRYSFEFNPRGTPGLPVPPTDRAFDFILSYSVFTHIPEQETIMLVNELRTRLAPGGVLVYTFIDPGYAPPARDNGEIVPSLRGSNLRRRLEGLQMNDPHLEVNRLLAKAREEGWCALVNGKVLLVDGEEAGRHEPSDMSTYLTYCTPEYMRAVFPDAEIVPPPLEAYRPFPTDMREFQHCCILRSD